MIVTPAVMYGPPSFSQWVTTGSVPRFASPCVTTTSFTGPVVTPRVGRPPSCAAANRATTFFRRRLQPDRQVSLARKQVRYDRHRRAGDVLEHDDRQATIDFEAPLHGRQLPPRAHLPRNPGQQLGGLRVEGLQKMT